MESGWNGEKANPPNAIELSFKKSRLDNLDIMRVFYPKAEKERQTKPPPANAGGGFFYIRLFSSFRDDRDHIFEQDLKCHGMSATQVGNEKLAVTLEDSMIELYFVGIVIAIKG
jgi:hypothetical protein